MIQILIKSFSPNYVILHKLRDGKISKMNVIKVSFLADALKIQIKSE